jgi:hypothetical protein
MKLLIGNCFFAAPPGIDAARVKENWFLLSFIMVGDSPICEPSVDRQVMPVFRPFWHGSGDLGRGGGSGEAGGRNFRGGEAGFGLA